jgi:ABC-2 type transport system ATP-binding protein
MRWPLPRPRLTRRRLIAGAVLVALLAGLAVWALWPSTSGYSVESRMVTVSTGPDGTRPVALDTTYYRPEAASAAHPAAAVLLAHGFGGT